MRAWSVAAAGALINKLHTTKRIGTSLCPGTKIHTLPIVSCFPSPPDLLRGILRVLAGADDGVRVFRYEEALVGAADGVGAVGDLARSCAAGGASERAAALGLRRICGT